MGEGRMGCYPMNNRSVIVFEPNMISNSRSQCSSRIEVGTKEALSSDFIDLPRSFPVLSNQ